MKISFQGNKEILNSFSNALVYANELSSNDEHDISRGNNNVSSQFKGIHKHIKDALDDANFNEFVDSFETSEDLTKNKTSLKQTFKTLLDNAGLSVKNSSSAQKVKSFFIFINTLALEMCSKKSASNSNSYAKFLKDLSQVAHEIV